MKRNFRLDKQRPGGRHWGVPTRQNTRVRRWSLALSLGAVLVVSATPAPALAFPSDPDTSFGTGGSVVTDFGSPDYEAAGDHVVQPDGKIVVVGHTSSPEVESALAVARYNPDGSLDQGFSGDGKAIIEEAPRGEGVTLQADGRTIVCGK